MSTVTMPRADIQLTDDMGRPTRDLYRWMRDITERVGGVDGAGTGELAASAFEDAGIPEHYAEFLAARDGAGQAPQASEVPPVDVLLAELRALRDELAEALKTIEGLRQGTVQ